MATAMAAVSRDARMRASAGKKKPRKALKLSMLERERLGNRVRRLVCSAPWEQVCVSAVLHQQVKHTDRPERELAKSELYPPGGPRTLMQRCRWCERWNPPQTVSGGVCDPCRAERRARHQPETDHQTHETTSSSVTGVLAMRGVELVEAKLAAEDEAVLRRQIIRYHATGRLPV
jgi:hypothetical protein